MRFYGLDKLAQWHKIRLLFIAILLVAVLLRVLGLFTDFWLDEVWTLRIVQLAKAPWELLAAPLNHGNNHILNSLFLYEVAPQINWAVYRLFAFGTGTAAIALLSWQAYRQDTLMGMTLLILSGLSYPFILYASESRGYAPALLFAVLAYGWLKQGPLLGRSLVSNLKFSGIVILGFLSHLTFLYVYGGILAWSALEWWQAKRDRRAVLFAGLRCHTVPLLFLGALYLFYIRGLIIGGGPIYSLGQVLTSTIGLTFGLPTTGILGILGLTLMGLMVAFEIWQLHQERSPLWIFFLTTIFLAPTLVLLVQRTPYIYVRYFLVCLPFVMILVAQFLCRLYQQLQPGKWIYGAVLAVFLLGNGGHLVDFLHHGRGQYYQALKYMVQETPTPSVTIGGDQDFQALMMVEFYQPYLPKERPLVYVRAGAWSAEAPEWAIVQSLGRSNFPPAELTGANAKKYRLTQTFLTTADSESGSNWHLYRRIP